MWFKILLLTVVSLVSLWDLHRHQESGAARHEQLMSRIEVLEQKLEGRDEESNKDLEEDVSFKDLIVRKLESMEERFGGKITIDGKSLKEFGESQVVGDEEIEVKGTDQTPEVSEIHGTNHGSNQLLIFEGMIETFDTFTKELSKEHEEEGALEQDEDEEIKSTPQETSKVEPNPEDLVEGSGENLPLPEKTIEAYFSRAVWDHLAQGLENLKLFLEASDLDDFQELEEVENEPYTTENNLMQNQEGLDGQCEQKTDEIIREIEVSHQDELKKIESSLAEKDREITSLKQSQLELVELFEKKVNEENKTIEELAQILLDEHTKQQVVIGSLERSVASLKGDIELQDFHVNSIMASNDGQANVLKDRITTQEKSIEKLEEEKKTLTKELEEKHAMVYEQTAMVTEQTAMVESLEQEIDALKEQLFTNDQNAKQLRDKQIHNLENKLNKKNKIIQDLKTDKEVLNKELEEQHASATAIASTLNQRIHELTDIVAVKRHDLNLLKASQEQQAHDFETRLNAKNQKIQELKTSCGRKLEELESQISANLNRIGDLQQIVDLAHKERLDSQKCKKKMLKKLGTKLNVVYKGVREKSMEVSFCFTRLFIYAFSNFAFSLFQISEIESRFEDIFFHVKETCTED
jgi:hypothetical protein